MSKLQIVPATEPDLPAILELIQGLAEYENLAHAVTATEARLRETLFGARPAAEVLLAHWDRECAGIAVFFATYSTFLAQPGLYLEDLYVKRLAKTAAERACDRLEWGVLDWNQPAIQFYTKLGAVPLNEWTNTGSPVTSYEAGSLGTLTDVAAGASPHVTLFPI